MQSKIDKSLEIIREGFSRYEPIAVFCSFGKDSVVLLDLCRQVDPNVKVVSIMTPYKFRETRAYKDYLTYLWELNIHTFEAEQLGTELYKVNPEACCDHFKVNVARAAVNELGIKAWFSGMRATEGETRRNVPVYQDDNGLMKINPILDFTEAEIYLYHIIAGIPIHPLYTRDYRSLGCEPCSAPGGAFEREGRFKGTSRAGGECNIHSYGLKTGEKLT